VTPTSPTLAETNLAVARALWAALRGFGGIPGATIQDQPDATLIRSRTPYANFNNLIDASIADDAADQRIVALLRAFAPDSLPVTWWAGPTTRPVDLMPRLERLGLARQEPEFAMALDLDAGWTHAPLPASASLEAVEQPDQLDEWLAIMNAAYGWPDAQKTAIVRAMYLADLSRPAVERDIHHFLVRLGRRAVACSSLFSGGDEAFVTNIGTRPEARGRGLGSAATVATLELGRDLGRGLATLTASVDGRGVYRRLGFREAGVLERYVATAETLARLGEGTERRR
jgi:ribosomal protein S18 acetylase RimI-like enzyme